MDSGSTIIMHFTCVYIRIRNKSMKKVFEKQTYFLKYFLFVENYLYPPSIISNFF